MRAVDISELGTILSIWAHPDDETFLCAGIMSSAAGAGQRVVCVTATRGEKGSQDPVRWPPETMGKVREGELLECMRILGVEDHRWLDYIDGECTDVPPGEATARIADLLDEVQPDTVLTFGPEGMTDHPDHKAVHDWVVEAFGRAAKPGAHLYFATQTQVWRDRFYDAFQRATVFEGDTPPITPEAELALDYGLPDEVMQRKLDAIFAHTSQVAGLRALFGDDMIRDAHTHERFVRAAP